MSEATAPAAPAPAVTPAPSTTPAQPATPTEAPAKVASPTVTPPPAEPRVSRKEVKANAAKELLAELTKRREGETKPDAEKPTGERKEAKETPKPKPDDKGRPEPKDAPQRAPDGKFAGKPGEAKPEPAKAPEPAAAPDRGEADGKLARALRELNSKTAEVETHSRSAKELKAKVDQYEAREAARKKDNNPLDILQDYGWDLDSVARAVVEKGLRPRNMRSEVPAELKQEIDSLKQFKERYEKQEQDGKTRQFRDNSLKALNAYLSNNAEKYPYSTALQWAGGTIVDATMRAGKADMTEQLIAFEKSMAETNLGLLGDERVFKAALASKPELKEKWLSWLGAATSKEADPPASKQARDNESEDGPHSLSSVPTGQAPKPKTRRESKRAAVRDFDTEWRTARNGG